MSVGRGQYIFEVKNGQDVIGLKRVIDNFRYWLYFDDSENNFARVIDPSLTDEIMVTVIATGFNHKIATDEIPNKAIESHLETKQQYKSVTEQENLPLHEQDIESSNQPELPLESKEPKKLFDDINHLSSTNDLEVPAFLRRQQD